MAFLQLIVRKIYGMISPHDQGEDIMGAIINIHNRKKNKDEEIAPEEKKCSVKKYIVKLISIVGTFCTITGITVLTLIEKDWQDIAEQYNYRGTELYNLERYEEAIDFYDKAIALENKGIVGIEMCYYNRGRAYFKLADYQKAVDNYTMAIKISPESKYYSDRAIAYEMMGDSANALLDNIKALTAITE